MFHTVIYLIAHTKSDSRAQVKLCRKPLTNGTGGLIMAKVKCRSCDICGEMNAKDGFMLKAKRMESHNVRDTLGYIIGVKYRWARIDLCESCYNEIVRSCHRIRREQKEG